MGRCHDEFSGERDLWSDEEQSYSLATDRLTGTGIGVAKLRQVYEREYSLKTLWHASAAELTEYKIFTPKMIETFLTKRAQINPDKVLADQKTAIQPLSVFPSQVSVPFARDS